MQDLGDFNGDGSIANAINASGQIVGIGYLRPDQEGLIAALWTSTHKMQGLGHGHRKRMLLELMTPARLLDITALLLFCGPAPTTCKT